MNILFLSGYGIIFNVDGGKLYIRDGRDVDHEPMEYVFRPKFVNYDNIVIYGHSGNISLDAMKWLAKHDVQLSILNWDGRLLSTLNPPEMKQTKYRLAQYKAFDDGRRLDLAKMLIDAKIKSSLSVLDWLGSRYDENRIASARGEALTYLKKLPKAKSIPEIRGIEGMAARFYFNAISSTFDSSLEFHGRTYGKTKRPIGAADPVNALFNYGYSLLESQCWRACNSSGLEPGLGFLHEIAPGSAPLIYDLQEPFRWLVDVTIIEALERKVFSKKDFIMTENYNIRLRPDATRRLVSLMEVRFMSKVTYGKKNWEWGSIIVQKTVELGKYLNGERKTLDLSDPCPALVRDDSTVLREKILNLSYAEWADMGYSKGTLHQLKKKARGERPFKIYSRVGKRIQTIDGEV